MDLSFVLTVPAVWSDKAKDITLNAAHLAGVPPNKLTLLSEPESAALYALRTIQPNTIKVIIFLILCEMYPLLIFSLEGRCDCCLRCWWWDSGIVWILFLLMAVD
jgi:hypothetical protein